MRWIVPLLLVLLAPVCAHAQDRKPVIGIEADVVVDPVTHERKARVDEAYSKAVIAAGGIPLVLSPLELDAAKALGKVDAIVLTGGADVPPELYGEKPLTADKTVDPARLKFGRELVRLSFERAIPILGIC